MCIACQIYMYDMPLHSFHVYDRMMREVNETKNGFHVVWVFRGRLASELLENFLSLEVF